MRGMYSFRTAKCCFEVEFYSYKFGISHIVEIDLFRLE